MTSFQLCLAAFLAALGAWGAIAGFALADRLSHDRLEARLRLSAMRVARGNAPAMMTLGSSGGVRPFLQRGAMLRLLLDPAQPDALRQHVAESLAAASGLRSLVRDAWGRGWPCSRWRRIGAWHVLRRSSAVDLHPMLQQALDGKDITIARAAAAMLGSLGDARAAAMLAAALRSDVRDSHFILMQLGRIDTDTAMPVLLPLLRDAPVDIRCGAVVLLSRCGGPEVEERMGELVDHQDGRVRKAVAWAMGAIATPLALSRAAGMLSDREGYVRAQAVRSLHQISRTQACLVASLVAPLRNDHDWWVRLAVREVYADLVPRGTRPRVGAVRGQG